MIRVPSFFSRLSPPPRLAAATALPVALLALLLALGERDAAREQAVAKHDAAIATRLGAARITGLDRLGGRLRGAKARALARALGPIASPGEGSVRLWTRKGDVIFTAGQPIAGRALATDELMAALESSLRGESASALIDPRGGSDERRIATFVPYRASPGGRVLGAFELDRPWESVAAGADGEALADLAPLLGALALFWAASLGALVLMQREGGARPPDSRSEANLDALTGLPDRASFRELLQSATHATKRNKDLAAVLIMDLDRFKEVNDTLGHYNGDMLLKRIGPRLRTVLRDQDTVARLGGDEFAILMPGLPDQAAVLAAAQRVATVFEEPFVLGGLALEVEASVGIAFYPEHGDRVDTLLQHADTAMYTAKTARTGFAVYSDQQDQGSRRRLALAGELRRAITEDEIVLHFQPKTRMATGEVTGVEALARWRHPTEGMISPSEFIPIAEQTNLLHALTERILDRALSQLREWHARGFDLTMAVNLSMRNLLDAKLADQVAQRLRRNGIEPSYLELELTEGMLMADPRRAMEILSRLKEVGVGLSVDDFGTGYSSLAYLKDLPVDAIKIDRSFVMGMENEPRNAAIVRSTVDLGRNLGLEVVAEGVETQAAYDELARLGCDYAQGFLLARPLPAPELLARVQELEQAREHRDDPPQAQERALRIVPSEVVGA